MSVGRLCDTCDAPVGYPRATFSVYGNAAKRILWRDYCSVECARIGAARLLPFGQLEAAK